MARPVGLLTDCGKVLREVLSAAGARGGGSADRAQGVCRAEQVEALLGQLVEAVAG
jgi:alanyl-tRNA synthetase